MRARALYLALALAVGLPTRVRADPIADAEQAIARGRYDAAISALSPLVARDDPRALALTGRVHRLRGELEPMRSRFRQVIALSNRGAIGPTQGEALWAVAEAAEGLGAFRDANLSYARAVEASPTRADIELAWSALFIEKHALEEARAGVARVLARDPGHAAALALSARIDLARGVSFAAVEAQLSRALARDPMLTAAHVTRAGIALRDEDLPAADRHLDAALAINPRDLEALSVRAAVRFVADDQAGFAAAVARVLQENPRHARLYSTVATYAEWEHRYAELVDLADAALKIDPDDASAHASRGINLLRTGREKEGLVALKEAWRRDRYDEQVFNLLELYERTLAPHYEQIERTPLRLRVAKVERALLAPIAIPLLLRAHATLVERYAFTPSVPTDVELYATPAHFAIRATGLPRLGVQGVCFGNVVIALSPRGGEFNWGQIVWHELAHVFHVQRSRGRVPRWFTEGLAEYETQLARPEWRREDDRPLYDALTGGTLPHLGELNRAFTHAQAPEQLTVAYYASTRAIDYIASRFGFEVVRKMLDLWGKGLQTPEVFERALGVSLARVDLDFRAAEALRLGPRYAADLRIDLSAYRDLPSLRQRSARADATADDHAGLAFALAEAGEFKVARARAEALLQEAPAHPLARFTLVHIALKTGDLRAAARELDALESHGHHGYQLHMLRARVAIARGDDEAAIGALEAAATLDPDRPEAHVTLSELAARRGDVVREERALTRVVALDQHARAPLIRLLALLRQRGAFDALLREAEAGLYRDVHEPAIHEALADALLHAGRLDEARVAADRARRLRPPAARADVEALMRRIEAARKQRPKPRPARIGAKTPDSR